MEIIDQNELIKNKEDEEMNNFTHYKISQKIKANKWKAIGIGISLILFCLIAVLFFRDSDKKKDTSLEKEKSLEISSSSSYLNDPYFKKYSEIFPFALRTSKEGQIEIENSMFEEISEDKLSFKKETSLNSHKTEVDEESKSSYNSDFSISIDISIYCDAKFKRKVQESKEHSNKIYLIGAKSNVCSLSVKRENIVFSKFFLNKIKDVAEDDLTDAEKAKELDKLFKDFGYYIPLKIYIGGYFYKDININKDNESMKKYLDFQANVEIPLVNVSGNYSSQSENYLKNFFYNENLVIKGGDINKESLDDWKLSINFDNSEIIDYSNIIKITDLINDALDKQTKKLLKIPLSLVDEKYIKRKKYFENLKELNNYPNMGNIKGGDSIRNGIFKTDELIYSEVIEIRNNKNIDYSYPDLIVGWKIDCFWQDRNKGDYSMTDPINSRRVKGIFSVKENNGLNLILEIFFLKCPE
jgi:hypothetical protein